MRHVVFSVLLLAGAAVFAQPVVWLEAESFQEHGAWSVDAQFVDNMGSPYLLATGLGRPVADATTHAKMPQAGEYRLWVRCKNWLPEHSPGRFQVLVNGKASGVNFGAAAEGGWRWIDGGPFNLPAGEIEFRLHDLTGWWGRCDAVVLAHGDFRPADDLAKLAAQREKFGGVSATIEDQGSADVVIAGGGLAGCGAAVCAARHGCRVVLLQDRPVLGGNASSEIQIPVEGDRSGDPFDPFDTGIIEEFYPEMRDTGRSDRLEKIVRAEKNIDLRLNTRAFGVEKKNADTIAAILAMDVRSGKRMRFAAPLFIDCTGHGSIGFWAGAEWRIGEEAKSEFNEPDAPIVPTKRTMGNDLYTAEYKVHKTPQPYTPPPWAFRWESAAAFEPLDSHKRQSSGRPANFDAPSRGKGRQPNPTDPNASTLHTWHVEVGGMNDVLADAESIRDELFRIHLGLWDYAKNHNPKVQAVNANREMVWLAYVMGTRESRRLIGDYVLTENDYFEKTVHPDTVVYCGWGMDIHHPEGFWVRGNDCMHYFRKDKISIPFRSLYSKNIGNLMMAGRCHSATHLGMGATRIMRTCCEMGQAVGTAAALAKRYQTTPRGIYEKHIAELQQLLLKDGCYLIGVPNRDPRDLALAAKATASDAKNASDINGPRNVNNGFNRAVSGVRNAWVPDLKANKLPQWVQLELDKPAPVAECHISFQTRLSRGVDFNVEAMVGGEWKKVAEIRDNLDRRRVIRFPAVTAQKVRIVFEKTGGNFGVCEIRLYGDDK